MQTLYEKLKYELTKLKVGNSKLFVNTTVMKC